MLSSVVENPLPLRTGGAQRAENGRVALLYRSCTCVFIAIHVGRRYSLAAVVVSGRVVVSQVRGSRLHQQYSDSLKDDLTEVESGA